MSKKDIHIVPHPDKGWATRREGSDRVSGTFPTQGKAIDSARDTARNDRVEVVIHGRDGKIRDRDSYGRDTNPPRDKKH